MSQTLLPMHLLRVHIIIHTLSLIKSKTAGLLGSHFVLKLILAVLFACGSRKKIMYISGKWLLPLANSPCCHFALGGYALPLSKLDSKSQTPDYKILSLRGHLVSGLGMGVHLVFVAFQ